MTPLFNTATLAKLYRALEVNAAKRRRAARVVPSIPAQISRVRMSKASGALSLLSDAQRQEWRDYAATQTVQNPKTGTFRTRQYDKVFVGLACRFLHFSPYSDVPLSPPPYFFAGDPIAVTAEGAGGQIVFTASGPTSPHVRVEVLVQAGMRHYQAPKPGHWKTLAFVEFNGEPVPVRCVPSLYLLAYRFFNVLTGQDTPRILLPGLEVPQE